MVNEGRQLHIFLFPFLAYGHMIPIVDMAKLLASRGVKITIVTTPLNSIFISKSLHKSKTLHSEDIQLLILKFPSREAGLPDGCENADSFVSDLSLLPKFLAAANLLQAPLEQALQQNRPSCLVADMFFPWADAKLGITRLIFHGTCVFSLCASEFMRIHTPYKQVSYDSEPFIIPHLPGEIKFTKLKLSEFIRESSQNDYQSEFMKKVYESESGCYGVVVNSFYELERDYSDCYRNILGRKTWHIGPVSLCNKEADEKAQRGRESSIDGHECLKWLDSKEPNSVVYVSFGSMAGFNAAQLKEIACGLEASGQQFIWVVRKGKEEEEDEEEKWVAKGFEERMEGKGLIIRGWAPQVLILDHAAVGGFVTHCGWNSTLEGVAAGVPMVTWPVQAEQFYNEILVIEVLKIGVSVGVQKWVRSIGDFVEREAVERAVSRIMVGEEGAEMRNRARGFAEKAREAIAEDGSSYCDLNALIEELKTLAF